MIAGSLNFQVIGRLQSGGFWNWFLFHDPFTFLAFFAYFTVATASVKRAPFDLAEAESELVAGYHTEYSSMKFGFFYLAEYINMITVSAIASSFFLGGPFLLPFGLNGLISNISFINKPSIFWLLLKILFLLFVFIWIRGTIPRYRYDQIMNMAWKYLIPFTLINLTVATIICYII